MLTKKIRHVAIQYSLNNTFSCTDSCLLWGVVVVGDLQHAQIKDEEYPLADDLEPHGLTAGGRTRPAALLYVK